MNKHDNDNKFCNRKLPFFLFIFYSFPRIITRTITVEEGHGLFFHFVIVLFFNLKTEIQIVVCFILLDVSFFVHLKIQYVII